MLCIYVMYVCMVWFGLVWLGLVWYGMVCYVRTHTHTEYAHRYGWAITITKELHMIDSNRSELYHLAPPRLSQEIAGGGLQYPWLSCTRPRPSYFVAGPRVEGRGPELGLKMIGNGGLTPQIWMNFMGKVLINHEILGPIFRQTRLVTEFDVVCSLDGTPPRALDSCGISRASQTWLERKQTTEGSPHMGIALFCFKCLLE